MKHRVVSITEFKAKCLSLLDDIGERGGTITVTKGGKPLATVGPVHQPAWKSPERAWSGKMRIAEGLLDRDTSELWEILRQVPGARD